jgi:precorrin isomerase
MLEEILGVLITLSSKHNHEKKPLFAQSVGALGMDSFHKDISQIMDGVLMGLLRSFDIVLDLVMITEPTREQVIKLIGQRICLLEKQEVADGAKQAGEDKADSKCKSQVDQLGWMQRLIELKGDSSAAVRITLEDLCIVLFRSINTYCKF